mgnify:CR=1 FL=1
MLTLALHALAVNAGAANKHVVDDGEAAFAADPVALAVPQSTVGQDSSLVESDAAAVLLSRQWELFGVEELPHGPVDDLIGRMTEDVDNRVGRVQYVGIVGEVCLG